MPDKLMSMAVRQVVHQIIGSQGNIRRRPRGDVGISPKARPIIVVQHGERLIVAENQNNWTASSIHFNIERYLSSCQPSYRIAHLGDPDFGELRAALRTFGYIDLYKETDQ